MSREAKVVLALFQLLWCVWMLISTWQQAHELTGWYGWGAFWTSVVLFIFWCWWVYRSIRPKPKKIDFVVEKDVLENWWVTRDGLIKSGPYTYRHQAFEWMIQETKKELRRR